MMVGQRKSPTICSSDQWDEVTIGSLQSSGSNWSCSALWTSNYEIRTLNECTVERERPKRWIAVTALNSISFLLKFLNLSVSSERLFTFFFIVFSQSSSANEDLGPKEEVREPA